MNLKNIKLRNNIVMAPMCTNGAKEGYANDFHIQHYGARAYGGAGLIIVEATAVSPEGLIRMTGLGLWNDMQIASFARVAKIITQAKSYPAIQLNHAGYKSTFDGKIFGSTKIYQRPGKNINLIDNKILKRIEDDFVNAAIRAEKAGFRLVEIHAAHGYLLSSLLHEKLNDVNPSDNIVERGKPIKNIIERILKSTSLKVGIRFSITDHTESGMKVKDFIPFIKEIESLVTYFHLSSGSVLEDELPESELIKKAKTHLFRITYAKELKKYTNVPIIVVGNFSVKSDYQQAINSGIEYVAFGRELLFNPSLPIQILGVDDSLEKNYPWADSKWYSPKRYKEYLASKKVFNTIKR